MQVSEIRLGELLEFLPEQGKILLKGSRVMIFDATSLGMLRKDLIDTLGMDRAKGFLIRYGWSCGFQAYSNIKKQFQWDEDQEGIFTGPIMHTLQGFALSEVFCNIDPRTGASDYKGYWSNSYEAEQHILHFGHHHEPVCWNSIGYASGYSSARLGKQVIYKEVQCVGKGDEHCSFIGKTVEDWGEEIIPELAYYEVSKISEELETAHQRIKTQNRILERTVTIHEQLTQCILKGQGIENITASLAELMKCTVIQEDDHLVQQSTCFPEQSTVKDILTSYLSILSSPSFKKTSAFYLGQKRPFQLADQHSDSLVYRLVSPILVGSQHLGFVSLLRIGLPFSDLENIDLEHAASVFALVILEQKKIAEVERRLKGDFIEDLLSENFADPNSIINRARGLNYDITLPHRVLVLEIHNFSLLVKSLGQNEKKILQFKTELVSTVQSYLERFGKGMVVNKSDNLILLVQQNKQHSPEKITRQLAEDIIDQVLRRFPEITLSMDIGSSCTELSDFNNSYLSARKALEIGKILKNHSRVISLEQFGTHALLFSALDPKDIYHFATNQIGALLTYDETYQTQLIPTLQEFLSHRGNVEGTARTMNMSISGLKYRLQRIEDITGQDPKEGQAFLNLYLAINILQLVGEDKIKS
jgi:purine catabolism regulator